MASAKDLTELALTRPLLDPAESGRVFQQGEFADAVPRPGIRSLLAQSEALEQTHDLSRGNSITAGPSDHGIDHSLLAFYQASRIAGALSVNDWTVENEIAEVLGIARSGKPGDRLRAMMFLRREIMLPAMKAAGLIQEDAERRTITVSNAQGQTAELTRITRTTRLAEDTAAEISRALLVTIPEHLRTIDIPEANVLRDGDTEAPDEVPVGVLQSGDFEAKAHVPVDPSAIDTSITYDPGDSSGLLRADADSAASAESAATAKSESTPEEETYARTRSVGPCGTESGGGSMQGPAFRSAGEGLPPDFPPAWLPVIPAESTGECGDPNFLVSGRDYPPAVPENVGVAPESRLHGGNAVIPQEHESLVQPEAARERHSREGRRTRLATGDRLRLSGDLLETD